VVQYVPMTERTVALPRTEDKGNLAPRVQAISTLICTPAKEGPVRTLIGVLVIATQANAASIGLFSTSDCGSCNLTIPVGISANVYVSAVMDDLYPFSLTAAEFRVTGLPIGWSVMATPNANANVVLGNPLDGGVSIGFPSPQLGGCVVLYTLVVTANVPASNVVLRVTEKEPPSSPIRRCPVIWINCVNCQTGVCVDGGEVFINANESCTVGVARRAWSAVRVLFR
jgi:hypothetical protein